MKTLHLRDSGSSPEFSLGADSRVHRKPTVQGCAAEKADPLGSRAGSGLGLVLNSCWSAQFRGQLLSATGQPCIVYATCCFETFARASLAPSTKWKSQEGRRRLSCWPVSPDAQHHACLRCVPGGCSPPAGTRKRRVTVEVPTDLG